MLWKSVVFTFFVLGALAPSSNASVARSLAQTEVSEEQRTQLRALLTQYCKKNGAEDQAVMAENAIIGFIDCAKTIIDPKQVQQEIEEAKPKGALDEVIKKYCLKSPQLKMCFQNLTTALSPCADPNHRQYIGDINNVTSQLFDFVCYKDGDRIALFIAESGPECLQEKMNPVRNCVTSFKETVGPIEEAKKLTLTEQCVKFDSLAQCVVTALEGCSNTTPGNMAEALFKFIKNGSPCKKPSS